MSNLKCPFCGHLPEESKVDVLQGTQYPKHVKCRTQRCPLSHVYVKPEDWNKRVPVESEEET